MEGGTRQVPSPALDVVIVNWNSGDRLRACVASLQAALSGGAAIDRAVVVDNGSIDGSVDGLAPLDGRLFVDAARENLGFARACNRGARWGRAPIVLFLNPDTLVTADALMLPIRVLENPVHDRTGVVGVRLVGSDGLVQRTCARRPTPRMFMMHVLGLDRVAPRVFRSHVMTDWPHDRTAPVDHVIGAFYAIRRELFERLGGFDERFFVYLEDLDLSMRVADAGYRILYATDASAVHEGGGTSGRVRDLRLAYALHSRIRFAFRHFTPVPAWILCAGTLCLEPWVRLAAALVRGRPGEMGETLRGYATLARRVMAHGLR